MDPDVRRDLALFRELDHVHEPTGRLGVLINSHDDGLDVLVAPTFARSYRKIRDGLKIPSMVGSYVWYEENDYKSWSGVELQIYRKPLGTGIMNDLANPIGEGAQQHR
jgi:hypothetical protein